MKRQELTKEIILIGVNQLIQDYPDEFIDQDTQHHKKDLANVYNCSCDGYEIMKELERVHYWDASLELANVLEYLESHVSKAYEKHLKQWMIDNDIQPPYPIGHKFTSHGRPAIISEIYKYRPYSYCVQFLDDGDSHFGSNSSRIYWFDKVGDSSEDVTFENGFNSPLPF